MRKNIDKDYFIKSLKSNSLKMLQSIPKSDLHNHAGRGGRIAYIEQYTNTTIPLYDGFFSSLEEVNEWLKENVLCHFSNGRLNYLKRVEGAFVAANEDNVRVLALDFGFGEIKAFGGMKNFMWLIDSLHQKYAPQTNFFPTMALYNNEGIAELDAVFQYKWFDAIDIINYQNLLTLDEMKYICKTAKKYGMRLKAHVGEYGTAKDVLFYASELHLDEIQHGIQIVNSPIIMNWIASKNILVNTCPTSNIKLGLCECYEKHPIRMMYDYNIKVTINTDDLLVFNSSISEEILKLYQARVFNENELFDIYTTGLLEYGGS